MIVCPACGRPTELGWTTCLNCGKALSQSRVKPGDTLPGREMPQSQQVAQAPQQQYQQQQPQYQQQPPPYRQPRKSCFARFIGWLILAFVLWWLFTHFIPAMSDLHKLFDNPYTTPHDVGVWFSRLIP